MIDPDIENKISAIRGSIDLINCLMADLYNSSVDIRIAYKEPNRGEPPHLDLWRATENIDYLKLNVSTGDIQTT